MHDLDTDTGRIPLSVLGLGLMGQALASAFLGRGHPTTVWNRTRAKAEPLTAQGAKHAWTVRDAVTAGPLVVICVSGYDNVRDILEPVSRDLAGRTLVNLTSGTSQAARETAKWAAHQGASYLDGAIMAVPPAIGTANATVLYSGPTTAFDRHQQALSSLGCPVYVGADHGLPSLFDAAALSLVWSTLNGFLHGAALLGKAGIPATAFARLARTGIETVADWLPGYAQQIDDGTYPATDSTVNTNLTGMKHLLHESHAADINTELPELLTTLAERAAAKGHSNNSYAAIIEQLRHPAQGGHGARRIPARARRYGDRDGPPTSTASKPPSPTPAPRAAHGHLAVPQAHRTDDGYLLGIRINVLRRNYAKGRLPQQRIDALDDLGMVWHTRDQANEQLIAHARAYHAAHGHLRVPHDHVTQDGYPLGNTLKIRRSRYAHGDVHADVVQALDELGMIWDLRQARFADGLAACHRYRDRHGDLRVPVTHTDPEGYNLGDFIAYQRALHAGTVRDRTGQTRTLLPERRAALDELGMLWTVATAGRPPTDAEIAALRALPHQRGNPPAAALLALVDAGVEQKALAHALDTTTSSLSERLKRAREIPSPAGPFASGLAAARTYHEHHGHLKPSEASDDADARTLSSWLTRQRRARRDGNLSDEQIAALDELGMEWYPRAARWQQGLQAARRYHGEHGHLRPSAGTVIDGTDLTVWLTRQRSAHRRGTLAPDRIAALDELGIDWTPGRGMADVRTEEAWQNRLDDARHYHAAHGHLDPPAPTIVNGRRLDAWLSVQRTRRNQGRLTPQQTAALDELAIRW